MLWIRKKKIKTQHTKSSKQDLISNSHVLFEVKTVRDSGFMNDRIALVSHSFAFVWTRLWFVFTRLYWSGLSFVFESSLLICTGLSSSSLVSHSSALVLPLVCNISNNFFYDQKTLSLNRSHKKRKDSLETRAVLKEIFMLCWNLENGPKHRGWLLKTLLSLKLISYLQAIFVLIWMKQTLIWFSL